MIHERYYHGTLQTNADALIKLIKSVRSESLAFQILTTNEGDAALEVCDHHFRATIDDISDILASVTEAPDVFIPKLAQRNLSVRRSRFKIKSRVCGDANSY